MTTITIDGDASDGIIQSDATTYANARSGGGSLLAVTGGSTGSPDQFWYSLPPTHYVCEELFLAFDTSAIPDGATITGVELKLYVSGDSTTTDYTVNVRLLDWGATLTTADWVAGASLSALTLLATLATSGVTSGAYNSFTENGSNFRSAINKTGFTRMVLSSSRQENGDVPSDPEIVTFRLGDHATTKPQLVVTYTTSTTVTSDVATSAAINAAIDKDVTSTAAIAMTGTKDVTTDASLNAPITADVASAAAINAVVASDVTSGAAIARTETKDVSSDSALARTETKDVASVASVQVSGTFQDVFTDAALSMVARETVVTDAALSTVNSVDLPTSASLAEIQYSPHFDQGELPPGAASFVVPRRGSGKMTLIQRGTGRSSRLGE